jgi:hypothetical protein
VIVGFVIDRVAGTCARAAASGEEAHPAGRLEEKKRDSHSVRHFPPSCFRRSPQLLENV